jgi:hypothetical protein
MAIEILILAKSNGAYDKGDIICIKEAPCVWGVKEGPPDFVRVNCADATLAGAQAYLYPWKEILNYEVIASNKQGWRVRLFFDRSLVSTSGSVKLTRERVENYLQSNYGISIHSVEDNRIVIDVPNTVDLAELKADLKDKIEKVFKPRRYYFNPDDIDLALNVGGIVNQTKAQLTARVLDKVVKE